MTTNIAAIGKAKALAALYNAARPGGPGKNRLLDMSVEAAEKIFSEPYADPFFHWRGRTLDVSFATDDLDLTQYDLVNGPNVGEEALAKAAAAE